MPCSTSIIYQFFSVFIYVGLQIFDKWIEKRKADEELRKKKEAGEEVEEPAAGGEDGEKPLDFAETVAQELQVSAYKVREIGELGVFESTTTAVDINLPRQGKGTMLFPNGDVYCGEYVNNKRHGKGTFVYANGALYVGDWEENQKHGKGRMVFPNGSTYFGDWDQGKRSGSGSAVYTNGDEYIGHWLNDKKHGEGTYVFNADKSKYVGQWEHGVFYMGTWNMCNRSTFIGEFKNGKPLGHGTFKFPIPMVASEGSFDAKHQWNTESQRDELPSIM